MRRLVVGDVHGCFAELQALVARAGLGPRDEIVLIGDFLDRGPGSPAVFEFVRSDPRVRALMGNHERKHIRSLRGEVRPALSQRITRRQMGEGAYASACAFLEGLPLYLELPEALLVHGCFEPGVPPPEQRDTVLTGTLSGQRLLEDRLGRRWMDLYDGDRPIVVGHEDVRKDGKPWVRDDGMVHAIDTGCCRGRRLTGLLLPAFELVSVPAARNHWQALRTQHADLKTAHGNWQAMGWARLDELVRAARRQPSLPAAAAEQLGEVRTLLAECDEVLEAFHARLLETSLGLEHEALLEADGDAAAAVRLFAGKVDSHPLKGALHNARRGKLTPDMLRRMVKTPQRLLELAEELDLTE